ncbi:MAG: hypothetical protein DRO09_00110 [Thermoprotei archaeon]|nr:MAG: hypothetical protein DRO09_00110 [Thermoprotei archaeon]
MGELYIDGKKYVEADYVEVAHDLVVHGTEYIYVTEILYGDLELGSTTKKGGKIVAYRDNSGNYGFYYDPDVGVKVQQPDKSQLYLMRSASEGASLLAYSGAGELTLAGNGYYDGSAWQRFNTSYPLWALLLSPYNDVVRLLRAPAGDNPASPSEVFEINSSGRITKCAGIDSQGTIVLPNNTPLQIKKTDGTPIDVLYLDDSNHLNIRGWVGTGPVKIISHAIRLYLDDVMHLALDDGYGKDGWYYAGTINIAPELSPSDCYYRNADKFFRFTKGCLAALCQKATDTTTLVSSAELVFTASVWDSANAVAKDQSFKIYHEPSDINAGAIKVKFVKTDASEVLRYEFDSLGGLRILPSSISDYPLAIRVETEDVGRFAIRADGKMEWGDGASARDVALFRNGVQTLAFQAIGTDVPTYLQIMPKGSPTTRGASLVLSKTDLVADPDNYEVLQVVFTASSPGGGLPADSIVFMSRKGGTGSYRPIVLGLYDGTAFTESFRVKTDGDIQIESSRALWFGADVKLYRETADILALDDQLSFFRGSTADVIIASRLADDTYGRFVVRLDGKIEWGNGTDARDVAVFRGGARRLAVQSLGTDVETGVWILPKGSPTVDWKCFLSIFGTDYLADSSNYNQLAIGRKGDAWTFYSGSLGTAPLLPLVFNVGGTESLRIETDGSINCNEQQLKKARIPTINKGGSDVTVTETSETLKQEITPDTGYSFIWYVSSVNIVFNNPSGSGVTLYYSVKVLLDDGSESTIFSDTVSEGGGGNNVLDEYNFFDNISNGRTIKAIRLYAYCSAEPASGYEPTIRIDYVRGLQS